MKHPRKILAGYYRWDTASQYPEGIGRGESASDA